MIEVIRLGTLNGALANLGFMAINLIIVWLAATILWVFPITLAKSFLAPELDLVVEPLATPSVLAIFVAAIGLFIFCYALVDLLYWVVYMHLASLNSNFVLDSENKANTIATILQLLIGTILILKCRTISQMISRYAR